MTTHTPIADEVLVALTHPGTQIDVPRPSEADLARALLAAREALRGVERRYREAPDYARTWLRGSCPFLDAARRCLPESEPTCAT